MYARKFSVVVLENCINNELTSLKWRNERRIKCLKFTEAMHATQPSSNRSPWQLSEVLCCNNKSIYGTHLFVEILE